MRHPSIKEEFGHDARALAERIAYLKYPDLKEFFYQLHYQIDRDARADEKRRRHQLSRKLFDLRDSIEQCWLDTRAVDNICRKHYEK